MGDLHRGASHGRAVHDLGLALRSVAWERFAGQIVQVVLTVMLLLVLPSPVRSVMPLVGIAVVAAVLGIVLVARARPDASRSVWARLVSGAAGDATPSRVLASRPGQGWLAKPAHGIG